MRQQCHLAGNRMESWGGSPTELGEWATLALRSHTEHVSSYFCHSTPNLHIPLKLLAVVVLFLKEPADGEPLELAASLW